MDVFTVYVLIVAMKCEQGETTKGISWLKKKFLLEDLQSLPIFHRHRKLFQQVTLESGAAAEAKPSVFDEPLFAHAVLKQLAEEVII